MNELETIMAVVKETKDKAGEQFNEQIDLYRQGKRVAIVMGFQEDARAHYMQIAGCVATFGADHVIHASEAWIRVADSEEEMEKEVRTYRRGDLAMNPKRKEALVVTIIEKATARMLLCEFSTVGGETVYGEPTELSEGLVGGAIVQAIQTGMKSGWDVRMPIEAAIKLVKEAGLLVMVEGSASPN